MKPIRIFVQWKRLLIQCYMSESHVYYWAKLTVPDCHTIYMPTMIDNFTSSGAPCAKSTLSLDIRAIAMFMSNPTRLSHSFNRSSDRRFCHQSQRSVSRHVKLLLLNSKIHAQVCRCTHRMLCLDQCISLANHIHHGSINHSIAL